MKKDTKNTSNGIDSNWPSVHCNPAYIKLQIEQVALSIEQQKRDVERSKVQVVSDRIEQARRNVEVVARFISGFEKGHDIYKSMETVLKENLEVLREVKNIK